MVYQKLMCCQPHCTPPQYEYMHALPESHPRVLSNDVGASSVSTCGRTTQCLGIISESEMLGVVVNLLELIGKTEEDQALGS
jgi:hypothetical protein